MSASELVEKYYFGLVLQQRIKATQKLEDLKREFRRKVSGVHCVSCRRSAETFILSPV